MLWKSVSALPVHAGERMTGRLSGTGVWAPFFMPLHLALSWHSFHVSRFDPGRESFPIGSPLLPALRFPSGPYNTGSSMVLPV